jgi:hypothetical protein
MSFNTEEIVQEIRSGFESMIAEVKGSRETTADAVERELFRRLLDLGAQLMQLFFTLRAEAYPRTPIKTVAEETLSYWGDKQCRYYSVFGKVLAIRPYFYRSGVGSASPLDAELGLGADCYSDLLRELVEYLATDVTYAKVSEIFERFLGHSISTHTVQKLVADDAADVEAFYQQKPAPDREQEAPLLVIQADGKGVPMVRETPADTTVRLSKGQKRTKKKEAVVTTVYTIAPCVRSPEQVVASFFDQKEASGQAPIQRSKPQNKQVWATLDGKDVALQRLEQWVANRQGAHIQACIALTDGCEALQQRVQRYFPGFTLILDFIHANEYLWKAANSLFGEQAPQRDPWVEKQTLAMLSGQTDQVIAYLRSLAQQSKRTKAQRKALETAANYFQRNLPYMRYHDYLAQGWPIASGVIEGACRHLVKDRCELSGMRWSQPGVENLLRLRAVAENGDWDAYHQFRRHQRHRRLYHTSLPGHRSPEERAFTRQPSSKIIRFHPHHQHGIGQPTSNQHTLAA